METGVISYRVADFLKKHAPFQAVADADLLALAGGGRVRFHEPHEYILWQGEPHRFQVFVIQQGTVSLWNETPDGPELRDVRGAGDLLGIERYNDAPACLYSVRSESDVVIYAFPATDFETLVLKYPHAAQYVSAESRVNPDYQPPDTRRDLLHIFLHDLVGRDAPATCGISSSISDTARQLLTSHSDAILLVDRERRARGVLTGDTLLQWLADGGGDPQQSVETLPHAPPVIVSPDASLADGLLAMGSADAEVLAITDDGTPGGRVQATITKRDLAPVFGDHPAALLHEARVAASTKELNKLNQRGRAFVLDYLAGPSSVEWLARFTSLLDLTILTRLVGILGVDQLPASWCFGGSSGRAESLTTLAPTLVAIFADDVPDLVGRQAHQRVLDALLACGYLPRLDLPFEASFYAASTSAWKTRYRDWVQDPVRQQTYRVRSLFDLRLACGRASLWEDVKQAIAGTIDRDFVLVLANDCFDSLPPLTFFQDAVIDSLGEHTTTFRLEHSALRPLVDVGRVVAFAARDVLGRSTIERFAIGRALLPAQDAIFREATDTLRIVLWQQGRVGISQGTRGAELPPALLSRHDRQVLKRGFRSILQLLEFTAALDWLKRL